MISPYKMMWHLFLLKNFLQIKKFNIEQFVKVSAANYDSVISNKVFNPQITVEQIDNITIINAYDLPRQCGKTALLLNCIDSLDDEHCAYIAGTMHMARTVLRTRIKNIYCKGYSQEYFLNCVAYQHFFFDEFGKTSRTQDLKEYHKEVTKRAIHKILDKNKPSYIVFIHRTNSDAVY